MNANKIIDSLGGTSAVAELTGVTTGAVSQWRTSENGVPWHWLKFFAQIRPDVVDPESVKTKESA